MQNNIQDLRQQLTARLNNILPVNPLDALNNNLRNRLSESVPNPTWYEEQNRGLEEQYRQAHPYWGYLKYDLKEGNPLRLPYEIKAELENLKKNYLNPIDYGDRQ